MSRISVVRLLLFAGLVSVMVSCLSGLMLLFLEI